jgi:hypothetical protein
VKQSNGSEPVSGDGGSTNPAHAALVDTAQQAAANCASAALVASRCSIEGVGKIDVANGRACIERCLDASRALSSASEILARPIEGDRVHLVVALARAALVAAEQCAAACAEFEDADDVFADCMVACHQADSSLHAMLSDLSSLADTPDEREMST